MTVPQLVDWDVALATARRLVPPGPQVSRDEARAAVAELRELAAQAEAHVRDYTGLVAVDDPGRTVVLDRPGWAAANVGGFQVVLAPVVEKVAAKRSLPGPLATAVGSRVTGMQVGVILSYLASRVLGQYEIFLPPGQGQGRLALVAPNIVAAERELKVDPRDFRLWVCIHEATHKAQFTAVPWLRGHLESEIKAFLDATDLDPAAMAQRLLKALGAVADIVRGRDDVSLIEAVQTPAQRAVLDRLTAVMTLVEGHADFVMDAVGPRVVPSVEEIRRKFDLRRHQVGRLDQVIRQLLGLDAKMRQYAEGHAFVAAVVERVGMAGFNRVWDSAQTLPTRAEITDPAAWVTRVIGSPADAPA